MSLAPPNGEKLPLVEVTIHKAQFFFEKDVN